MRVGDSKTFGTAKFPNLRGLYATLEVELGCSAVWLKDGDVCL